MDDEVRRRFEGVEDEVRSIRHRLDQRIEYLGEKVSQAQRAADIAIDKMEESMAADVAEAKRVDLQFNAQNKELAAQTAMLAETRTNVRQLAEAEQRRAAESMRIRAVNEAEEKRLAKIDADRKKRYEKLERFMKFWPAYVALASLISWIAATVVAHWK